ncbi:MAG: cytotoxin [Desulfosporosinus sp. BRH_c37]|nr:MAG: cytotoxin [Desulfosporosinus sp. BRH_c37]
MEIKYLPRFKRAYGKLPENIKDLFDDKIYQFLDDWRHPSLRIHMLGGTDGVWSASLNMSIRFTFSFEKNLDGTSLCVLRNIGDHDSTMRPPY